MATQVYLPYEPQASTSYVPDYVTHTVAPVHPQLNSSVQTLPHQHITYTQPYSYDNNDSLATPYIEHSYSESMVAIDPIERENKHVRKLMIIGLFVPVVLFIYVIYITKQRYQSRHQKSRIIAIM
jgi:hypothetical protein